MTWLLGIWISWLLMLVGSAQKQFDVVPASQMLNVVPSQNFNQRSGLKTECLGSFFKLTVDKSLAFGSRLEFDAINGSQIEALTPRFADKCGFSVASDPWGNANVYASLLNCFAVNEDDAVFDIDMRVRVLGVKGEQDVFEVEKTCNYDIWAPREILCNRNYMEVSVNRLPGDITAMQRPPKLARMFDDQWTDTVSEKQYIVKDVGNRTMVVPIHFYCMDSKIMQVNTGIVWLPTKYNLFCRIKSYRFKMTRAITSKYNIWRIMFYTPQQKAMLLVDALNSGYGITTTKSRLVLRSGYDMPETYVENVNGVPMKIIRVTTYFKKQWSVTMLDTVAACPTGGLVYTDEMITWNFPRLNPLMDSTETKILGVFMGIDGKQIDSAYMAARGYSLTIEDAQIVMKLPMGGPDGYYKSHTVNNQYHIRYNIEPMLELLWSEGGTDATRYKVLFPIKTPLMPRLPQLVDNTDSQLRVFDVLLGSFLYDVEFVNITFSTGVLTVAEATARGVILQEHRLQNGSKTIRLQVPFSDQFVIKSQVDLIMTVYTLPLIFGFMILPENTPFSYSASVAVTLHDVVLPTISGKCDKEKFYVQILFGNGGKGFTVLLGKHDLTPERKVEYEVKENGTHMSLAVPFLASDVAFELMYPSSLKARLDVFVQEPVNKWNLGDFSLSCNFPMTMTECFNNGSMSALAVKVESVTQLSPRQLTLRDSSCKPKFSNDRFAYFTFNANSCGTSRTFYDGVMMYQNEITLSDAPVYQQPKKGVPITLPDAEYRVTVSCFYTLNDTQTIAFFTKPRESEPLPETGFGVLDVILRLALDGSYNDFYLEENYPVVQYLRSPLFFEVALLQSTDPQIELVLENCWATLRDERNSTPRWDLIVDGCVNLADRYETVLHPVASDRVRFPTHVKRFEMQMFAFVQQNVILKDQIFVHCDAVLCDINQIDGICKRQCPSSIPLKTSKGIRTITRKHCI